MNFTASSNFFSPSALHLLFNMSNGQNNSLFSYECINITDKKCFQSLISSILQEKFKENLALKICLGIFYILVFLVGVIGNMVVIFCILSFSFMRTVTNTFLFNLAVSDLFVFLFCEPLLVAYLIYPVWLYGQTLCKLGPLLQGVSVSVSIFTLVSISIERFVIVHKPITRYKLHFQNWKVFLWILIIWVISFAICIPLYFGQDLKINENYATCEEFWEKRVYKKVYTLVFFFLLYLMPIAFMGSIYLKLSQRLWYMPQQINKMSPNNTNQYARWSQRRKLSIVLISLFAAFAICWLPYHVVNIIMDFTSDNETIKSIGSYAFPVVHLMCFANSAIDPFCSLLLSAKFGVCLQRMRKGRCCQFQKNGSGQRGRYKRYRQGGYLLQTKLATPVNLELVVRVNEKKVGKHYVRNSGPSPNSRNGSPQIREFECQYVSVRTSDNRQPVEIN